jgi:hypothetical protein
VWRREGGEDEFGSVGSVGGLLSRPRSVTNAWTFGAEFAPLSLLLTCSSSPRLRTRSLQQVFETRTLW